jgi:phosphatidyl-myo-inositol dimannoside synthase
MQALDASSIAGRVYPLPQLIPHPIEEPIPEYDRKAWRGSKPDLVICGHLNLLPAAWFLAWLRGARLALTIHGIEAWKRWPWLYGLMLKSVDSFIAVSRYSADRFATWSNISNEQSFVLPNCVDLNSLVPEVRDEKLVER